VRFRPDAHKNAYFPLCLGVREYRHDNTSSLQTSPLSLSPTPQLSGESVSRGVTWRRRMLAIKQVVLAAPPLVSDADLSRMIPLAIVWRVGMSC
jgi:hypothetical protein